MSSLQQEPVINFPSQDPLAEDAWQGTSVTVSERSEMTSGPIPSDAPSPPTRRPAGHWLGRFNDWSIGKKQLLALIVCELVPIVGLGITSTLVVQNGLYEQLRDQATSEVAVMETNYNIKINQMGFGGRGQADNLAIVEAASINQRKEALPSDLQTQVRRILQNEVKARQIEYATLVSKDLRIIVNANANRAGEVIDNSELTELITRVLNDPQQIKATAIVPWNELVREAAPVPDYAANQDALIRYVVTPVTDPKSKEIIGVLVFGDVVNGKLPIVENTLKALGSGYSAVYLRQPNGEFTLATSLEKSKDRDLSQAATNVPLPNQQLLTEAAKVGQGKSITQRITFGDRTYTVAVKALPNRVTETSSGPEVVFGQQPIALLVRGTPEDTLNMLMGKTLQQEVIVVAVGLGVIILWSTIFRRTILSPLQDLEQVARQFIQGNRQARAEVVFGDEVGQLAATFNQMADSMSSSERSLAIKVEQAQQLNDITSAIRQSLQMEQILDTAVRKCRDAIATDRVIVYAFDPDWGGSVVAESVGMEWPVALGANITDPCFADQYVDQYRDGRIKATDDIYHAGLAHCHVSQLEVFAVRANLVVPILFSGQLYGLLIAHHCRGSRHWEEPEMAFMEQIAIQVGFALEQSRLLIEQEKNLKIAEAMEQQQRQQKESLQQQLVKLLMDVENVADGDLTVRTDVFADEIGTVADFFNSIVESLRQVVTQVKQTVLQVNQSLGHNGQAIHQLAEQALTQAEDITQTLDTVEQMTQSIYRVAEQAHQAAAATHHASTSVETSRMAMDFTVQTILGLRETIGATTRKVQSLGDSSQQISKVVSLINDIALQTNVLAINAGIEASRAGVEGKGFAVVAEEVGALAARSAAATKDIAQIVDVIQRETHDVVEAMQLGNSQVAEGTRLVEEAKRSLEQVFELSGKVDELVKSVSAAAVAQTHTSQTISQVMQEIAQVSGETSQSSKQVATSLRETVEIAQQLQESVAIFKVD